MVEGVLTTRRPLNIFILILLILLGGMSYQVTDQETGRTVLGSVLFRMFSPFQLLLAGAYTGITDTFHTYFGLVGTNKENEQLKREVEQLKVQLRTTAPERQENARLRQILDLRQKMGFRMVVGEIIGVDARAAVSDTVTVNSGRSDGVYMEMPVVTPEGIVGMTILVTPYASQVQLISSAGSAVGAMLERSKVAGLLVGSGGGLCVLKYLPLITDVKPGDVVITSGQDGVFPQGLPIGKVTHQVTESQYYKSAQVMPFQNFRAVREVIFLIQSVQPETANSQ